MKHMVDTGLGAKLDKKNVSYVVAGVFCVYALVYKIPIPCFGCQKNGFWYRCVIDTGEGTEFVPLTNKPKIVLTQLGGSWTKRAYTWTTSGISPRRNFLL